MILFKSFFQQLLGPYVIAASVLTFILSMDTIYKLVGLIVSRGVDVLSVVAMLLYRLPQFLSITLPIASVIAICVLMVRLSGDSEVIALRGGGVGLWQLSAPIWVFGAMSSLLGWVLTLWLQPWGYASFEQEQVKLLKSHTTQNIEPQVFNDDFPGWVLHVQKQGEQPNTYEQVFIAQEKLEPDAMVVIAERGEFEVREKEQNLKLVLYDGTMHTLGETPDVYRVTHFEDLAFFLKLPSIETEKQHIWGVPTPELFGHPKHKAYVELLLRFTTPLASLGFALATMVLSIADPRKGRTGAYLKILILITAYYILWLLSKELTYNLKWTPHVLWTPPIIIMMFGFYHTHKVENRLQNIKDVWHHFKNKR